tara:strand:+ start:173 stop:544 length:372 start_codon:yes stop_codon:yes gene_type:complete
MRYIKINFHILNILLILFYLFPGSILGCIFYNDCSIQPKLTRDFLVSSNHLYAFILLSILGFLSYSKNIKKIFLYLLSISIILELLHFIVPNRSFQFSDLFGNMAGVLVSILILILFNFWRKK